ncbi:hypothetical protein FOS14_02585 [Skermania sp. ID1734]|uniref:hypothetical protein n=1 Tax=Skermania sp. ID1734 TaxID=2597516 RepID=UPI0011804EBD|nr:hypothetical protein [Skermania sp. ID1734]TSE01459.1 hypothetical protein FOS14_02585 [Skermania sp. ID1734]
MTAAGQFEIHDTRTLLGMHTSAAWAVAALFLIAEGSQAIYSWSDVTHRWPIMLALALTAAAVTALIAVRGDPLPRTATLGIAFCGPVSCALVALVIPAPPTSSGQLWPFPAGTACAVYLCVRGRTPTGWLDQLAMLGVAGIWGARSGQGISTAVMPQAVNIAPVLMATFFAYVIRPAARQIVQLREESTRRVAAESAAEATLAERADQMRRVDAMVRPALTRILQPAPLQQQERLECALLEAELRDSLRAPALADRRVADAARAARARGVEVALIDDHGLDGASDDARVKLHRHVVAALDGAATGSVAVRILPPYRELLATVVVNDGIDNPSRFEINRKGEVEMQSDKTGSGLVF